MRIMRLFNQNVVIERQIATQQTPQRSLRLRPPASPAQVQPQTAATPSPPSMLPRLMKMMEQSHLIIVPQADRTIVLAAKLTWSQRNSANKIMK